MGGNPCGNKCISHFVLSRNSHISRSENVLRHYKKWERRIMGRIEWKTRLEWYQIQWKFIADGHVLRWLDVTGDQNEPHPSWVGHYTMQGLPGMWVEEKQQPLLLIPASSGVVSDSSEHHNWIFLTHVVLSYTENSQHLSLLSTKQVKQHKVFTWNLCVYNPVLHKINMGRWGFYNSEA